MQSRVVAAKHAEDPFVQALLSRDRARVQQLATPALRRQLQAGVLAAWEQQLEAAGQLRSISAARRFPQGDGLASITLLQFERAVLELKVTRNVAGEAEELRVRPGSAQLQALAIAQDMARGQSDAVYARFNGAMKLAMSERAVAELLGRLRARFGDFSIEDMALAARPPYEVVTVSCAAGKFALKLTLDPAQAQLAGLYVVDALPDPRATAALPSYADPAAYVERQVMVGPVGSKGRQLPGTLTMPKRPQPCAAIVLIHGSGPADRDETHHEQRPFRDLALGLASRGVAVLRYEKRTYPPHLHTLRDPSTITFDEEAVDDALLAAQLLMRTEGVDPRRVFVAGHSQGGTAAAVVARREPLVAGVVLMAAPARLPEDLILEQAEYLAQLQPQAAPDQQLAELRAQVAVLKSDALASAKPSQLPFGAPASYWQSLRSVRPIEWLPGLGKPVLLLQGARDYQVRTADFELWQRAFADSQLAELHLLPGLNHLLVSGNGPSTPAEYHKPAHVSEEVIALIVRWLETLAARSPSAN